MSNIERCPLFVMCSAYKLYSPIVFGCYGEVTIIIWMVFQLEGRLTGVVNTHPLVNMPLWFFQLMNIIIHVGSDPYLVRTFCNDALMM